MPDWISHLGAGYVFRKFFAKYDLRVFLLGLILPDIIIPPLKILEKLDLLPDELMLVLYTAPFHSPFIQFIFAAFISLFNEKVAMCFFALFSGSMIHLVLDALQFKQGEGVLFFYPLSFRSCTYSIFNVERLYYIPVVLLFLFLLIRIYRESGHYRSRFRLKNLPFALVLLVILAFVPYWTKDAMMQKGPSCIGVVVQPEQWEGKDVGIFYARVISENPCVIEHLSRPYALICDRWLEVGDRVSFNAIYRGGKLYTREVYVHNSLKWYYSLIGLFFIILMFLK